MLEIPDGISRILYGVSQIPYGVSRIPDVVSRIPDGFYLLQNDILGLLLPIMLKFKIKELVLASGHKFPGKFLIKQCGLPVNKARNIISGKQKAIALDDFSLICKKIDVSPNELLYWKQNPNDPLPEGHSCLTKLTPPDGHEDWNDLIGSLSPEDAEEIRRLALEKKNKK